MATMTSLSLAPPHPHRQQSSSSLDRRISLSHTYPPASQQLSLSYSPLQKPNRCFSLLPITSSSSGGGRGSGFIRRYGGGGGGGGGSEGDFDGWIRFKTWWNTPHNSSWFGGSPFSFLTCIATFWVVNNRLKEWHLVVETVTKGKESFEGQLKKINEELDLIQKKIDDLQSKPVS